MAKVPKHLPELHDRVNSLCAGVSMPLLASFFLFVHGRTLPALLFLAAGIGTAGLPFTDYPLPQRADIAAVVAVVSGVSTVAVTSN